MDKTRTSTDPGSRITRGQRVFVFAGPGIAALCAAVSLALGADAEFLLLMVIAAVVWMALATLACALWRGIVHGDWSSFRRRRRPDPGTRMTRRERVILLAGPGVAALCAAVSLALGAGAEFLPLMVIAAVVWMALATLACALWRGIVHGDWSRFRNHSFDDRSASERFDYDTRTGSYSYLRDWDDDYRR